MLYLSIWLAGFFFGMTIMVDPRWGVAFIFFCIVSAAMHRHNRVAERRGSEDFW